MIEHHPKRSGVHPVIVAIAVAMLGALAMLIVDHGASLEPEAPGSKPAQPASPD